MLENSKERLCLCCNDIFTKRARNQRFCSHYCRDKFKHDEYVRDWINRKPRKRDPRLGAKLEMAALFGQPNFLNKYNACRG